MAAALPSVAGRDSGAYARVGLGMAAALAAGLAAVALGPRALGLPVALAAVAIALRFPPALLAAFVFIPFFESAPGIRMLPVDPTPALGALLVVVYAQRVASRSVSVPPAGFVIALLVVGIALAIGLIGTPAPEYGGEKVVKYFTVTLLAAIAPFFVVRTRDELQQFLGAIVVAGMLVATVTPFADPTVIPGITYELDTQGRYSFGGQIFPARFLFTAALVLLAVPACVRGGWRYVCPLLAVGVIFVALGFGARGPVVAFIAALLAVALLSALRSPRQLVLVLLVVSLGAMVLPFVTLPGQSTERLAQVAADPVSALQGDTRSALYDQAFRLMRDDPLTGIGTGGFSTYTAVITPPKFRLDYPHNVFLELSTDVGIVPAVVLALAIVAGMARLLRRIRISSDRAERNLAILVMGLFLLNFFATQFSGDINDNRTLWLFLAIAWLVGRDGLRAEPPSRSRPT